MIQQLMQTLAFSCHMHKPISVVTVVQFPYIYIYLNCQQDHAIITAAGNCLCSVLRSTSPNRKVRDLANEATALVGDLYITIDFSYNDADNDGSDSGDG